ncbi:helix-turn-helix domain-containing protein [Candidatus Gracilibacteria bacterium]|nr:helix-turn-helix domain-containing protein [Candidatus Gracilibacteria bacterium]MCF7898748.1 helix-turn-helix domain-containing protein [Candidatus Paceibacterota bacterium]
MMREKFNFEPIDNLVERRMRQQMSQTEFWGQFGITQSSGSGYESGKKAPVQANVLMSRKNQNFSFKPIKNLFAIRVKNGMNQTEFWGQFKIPQSTGSRYESGERPVPKYITALVRLAYPDVK